MNSEFIRWLFDIDAIPQGAQGLRIAVLGGWFREMALAEATDAVDAVARETGHTAFFGVHRDGEALLHAARQALHIGVALVAQVHQAEQLAHRAPALRARRP